ncbi:hypothetical protein EDB80DRAFT_811358 [Ilyonectria destructans]|nr:hypothetical protein EDB80DRAFT_811358 [Ilyonectria destructans]
MTFFIEPFRGDPFPDHHFYGSVSDASSEWEIPSVGPLRPTGDPLPLEVAEFFDAPLTYSELVEWNSEMRILRHPGYRYAYEYCIELGRVRRGLQASRAKMNAHATLLSLQKEREPIVIRQRIRKRWQELGIWNSDWGIPYHQPRTFTANPYHGQAEWKWEWEITKLHEPGFWVKHRDQGSDASFNLGISPTKVAEGASMREAEAFIVSIPWVTYNIHMAENLIRFKRVPKELRTGIGRRDTPRGDQVRRRWEERGQWNDSWDEPGIKEQSIQPGWTWRDETPEPEPEPLDFLQFDTADFTKLEAAEWEAIPLPSLSTMKLPPDRVSTEPTTDLDTPWMAPFESTGSIAQSLECDNEKQDCEQSDDELEAGFAGITAANQGTPTFASVPICTIPVPKVLSSLILSTPPGDELEATTSAATPPDKATASLAPRDAICAPPVPGTSGVLFVSALSKDELRSLFSSQPIQDELEAGPVEVTPDSAAAPSPPGEASTVPHVSSSPRALQVSALSKAQLESLFPLGDRREAGPADGSSSTRDEIPAPDIFILSRITKEQLQLLS